MTTLTTPLVPVLGETILVQVGNGASPEIFTAPALINTTRSLSMSTAVTTDEIVDLNNQANAAVTVRYVSSTDLQFDGAGTLDANSTVFWMNWISSGQPRNCKITQTNLGANGGWTITAPFSLLTFKLDGDRRKQTSATISLGVSGAYTVTNNA